MFANTPQSKPDPILFLQELFNSDPRPAAEKINLGIGVYCDSSGLTPIMAAVKIAEQKRVDLEQSKKYVGIRGLDNYCLLAQQLALGEQHELLSSGRLATLETPGGTGAFRIACEFIHRTNPEATIWNSSPGWPNHAEICRQVGITTKHYSYYNHEQHGLDFAAMLSDLSAARSGDLVLVHNCCHNPSGADLSSEQWQQLAEFCSQRGLVPIVDNAYQGFANGLSSDREGVLSICRYCPEAIICLSHSKNFGLYRERIGALMLLCAEAKTRANVTAALCSQARANYSMPPVHGAFIVEYICSSSELRQMWEDELERVQQRINNLRSAFANSLEQHVGDDRFAFVRQDRGMFSLLGLNPEQVRQLREQHGVYLVNSSRVNIAGLSEQRVDQVAAAISSVLPVNR